MKKILSVVIIMILALSMSMTALAGSSTKTATTSGGSKSVPCTFTLLCKRGYSASYDGYILTCTNSTSDSLYYYHDQIISTMQGGSISTIAAAMSELTKTKIWQGGTGPLNMMYSSSTQARVAAGSFGTTSYVQLAATY